MYKEQKMRNETIKKLIGKKIRITHLNIDELKPVEYYSKDSIAGRENWLKMSVEELGFIDPIIVNTFNERENVVIDGWSRVQTYRAFGKSKIPVIEVYLNQEQEKKAHFVLNDEVGSLDYQKLLELMGQGIFEYLPDFQSNFPVEEKSEKNKDKGERTINRRSIFLRSIELEEFNTKTSALMSLYNVGNLSELVLTLINKCHEDNFGK